MRKVIKQMIMKMALDIQFFVDVGITKAGLTQKLWRCRETIFIINYRLLCL